SQRRNPEIPPSIVHQSISGTFKGSRRRNRLAESLEACDDVGDPDRSVGCLAHPPRVPTLQPFKAVGFLYSPIQTSRAAEPQITLPVHVRMQWQRLAYVGR